MRNFFNAAFLAVIACLTAGSAGAIADKAGTTTGEFLRLPAGAKPAAMGEAYSALADGAYSMYFNVAGLAQVQRGHALLAHTMYYEEVNHEYLAYARPFMGGGLGASATYLGTTFEIRTSDTEESESGTAGDFAFSAGYGRRLLWHIDAGIAVKYINSKLGSYKANAIAADAGLQMKLNDKISAGLAIDNIGGKLKYISETVDIGSTLDAGIAAKGLLSDNLTVALDYKTMLNAGGRSLNAGAEYLWKINENWALAPRAGYISHNSTITGGMGFNYKKWQFDYAINTQADLGISNRFSLGIRF